jgi:hypothetical protein
VLQSTLLLVVLQLTECLETSAGTHKRCDRQTVVTSGRMPGRGEGELRIVCDYVRTVCDYVRIVCDYARIVCDYVGIVCDC